MKKIGFFLILIAFICTTLIPSSCVKDKKCNVVITVYDSSGTKVQANVNIKMFANVTQSGGGTTTADLKAEGVTDASGQFTQTFKLPAILDVVAEKPNCTPTPGNYCKGKGIVKMMEGETVTKSIMLKE